MSRTWAGKRNGELLQLMIAERFDVLLTVDRNLGFQRNVRASGIGVIVVLALTNRVKELRSFVPQIRAALAHVTAGELVRIGG